MSCWPFKKYTSKFPALNCAFSILNRKESASHREHAETVQWNVKPRPQPQQWFGMRWGRPWAQLENSLLPTPRAGAPPVTWEGTWVDSPRDFSVTCCLEFLNIWNASERDCFKLFHSLLEFLPPVFLSTLKTKVFFGLWARTAHNAEGKAHFLKSILGDLTP